MKKAQVKKLSTEELVEKIRTLSAERWRAIYAGKSKDGNRMFDSVLGCRLGLGVCSERGGTCAHRTRSTS
jgi:hypothetical protein